MHHKSQGFALVLAIGLLIVFGSVSAYVMGLFSSANAYMTQAIQYQRVLRAAESGLLIYKSKRKKGTIECSTLKPDLSSINYQDIQVEITCAPVLGSISEIQLKSTATKVFKHYPYQVQAVKTSIMPVE